MYKLNMVFILVLFTSCSVKKEVPLTFQDSVKIDIPIEVQERVGEAAFSDTTLENLPLFQKIEKETDSTIIVIYRDTATYNVKTIFKKSKIHLDTIVVVKVDTVVSLKYKEQPISRKGLLFKAKKHYTLTLLFLSLIIMLTILFFLRFTRK